MAGSIETLHLTLSGRKHSDKGISCEDDSNAVFENGVHVVCLSDGAGASQYQHSHMGSKSVVSTICSLMTEHFDEIYSENKESLVRSLIIAAIQAELTLKAAELSLTSIESLSATMAFCAVKDTRMIYGHLGDGLIVRITGSGMHPLSVPQTGESISSTLFVTLPNAHEYFRIARTTTDDTHAVVLMTDGVSEFVYDDAKMLIYPVVARIAEHMLLPEDERLDVLRDLLHRFIIDTSPLTDDVSLGLLYFHGTPKPDPDQLPKDKPVCIHNHTLSIKDLQKKILPKVHAAREYLRSIEAEEHGKESVVDLPTAKATKKMTKAPDIKKRMTICMYVFAGLALIALAVLTAFLIRLL